MKKYLFDSIMERIVAAFERIFFWHETKKLEALHQITVMGAS